MGIQEHDVIQPAPTEPVEKKPYTTPTLTLLGGISELTKTGLGSRQENKGADDQPTKFP